jgi:hypothetical protein
MIKIAMAKVALMCLLAGCASSDKLELLAGSGQEALVRDGAHSLISAKKNIVMLQAGGSEVVSGARPTFVVAIRNMQNANFLFRASEIKATRVLDDGTMTDLKVWGYDELVKEERTRQTWAAVGAALGGVSRSMNAANAGYSQTNGSFNAYNSYGGSAHGTYQSTTYNSYQSYSAQQLANAQTSADFAMIRSEGQNNLAALKGSIIKDNTLMPGEWYGGTIVLDAPKKSKAGVTNYIVLVTVEGETHQFRVSQRKTK